MQTKTPEQTVLLFDTTEFDKLMADLAKILKS